MGLDMFLERHPIIIGKVNGKEKELTPTDINIINSYISGFGDESKLEMYDKETIDKVESFSKVHYSDYDLKHEHPRKSSIEEIGYWRKANAIHKWFVDNVQGGSDDCRYHRPVTKEDLIELRNTCKSTIRAYYDGDEELVSVLLPTEGGFFFGSTDYDNWYLKDLELTIHICEEALCTNFDEYKLFYVSSW